MPQKKGFTKATAQQGSDSIVYVRLVEPMALRKTVLNLTLDTIQLLKRYDNLKTLAMKKQSARQKLAKTYGEIKRLSFGLKLKELPGFAKAAVVKQPEIKKESVKFEAAKPMPKPKPLPGLSPLEKEMESIRNKLANL